MLDDINTEDDKAVSPFLADGDKKQGDTAEERTEHPDPAQPSTYSVTHDQIDMPDQEADDAPVSVGAEKERWGTHQAEYDASAARRQARDRENTVATEGTTEVPASGYQFADPNDPIRQRYVEMERQKDEQIAELVKQGDGRPKV